MNQIKGLVRAEQIYRNRQERAKEYKAAGGKVAAYFCCYTPVELMTAMDYLPLRIMGDADETVTEAEAYTPVMCGSCRSCLDLGLKGKYDFIDAFIGGHTCDGVEWTSFIWRTYIKSPCSFHMDVPHTSHAAAIEFFKEQLLLLKSELEDKALKKPTTEDIKQAVKLHNRQRSLVRELYGLNKNDPPLVSGSEMLHVMTALLCIPVVEGNELLEEVIKEVKERSNGPAKQEGRILIWGSLIDNTSLTKLIEECGLNIVVDDTAVGLRSFWADVEETDDPLDGIATRYLDKVNCPRTFRDTKKTRLEDLENRFGYLKKMAEEWKVNGVYLNIIKNCDVHGYEIPELRSYFEMMDLPVLVIEQAYSSTGLEPLRTRFQAFAESIG